MSFLGFLSWEKREKESERRNLDKKEKFWEKKQKFWERREILKFKKRNLEKNSLSTSIYLQNSFNCQPELNRNKGLLKSILLVHVLFDIFVSLCPQSHSTTTEIEKANKQYDFFLDSWSQTKTESKKKEHRKKSFR